MSLFRNLAIIACLVSSSVIFSACAPEVGSDEWCEKMKGKSDDDMTVEEAKIYAKNCLIK